MLDWLFYLFIPLAIFCAIALCCFYLLPRAEGALDRPFLSPVPTEKFNRRNGESPAQMDHIKRIKRNGGVAPTGNESDTGKDQDWEYDDSLSGKIKDWYVFVTTFLWLGPKILVMVIPLWILHLVPMLIARMYVSSLADGTERIHRSKIFYVFFIAAYSCSAPAVVLVMINLLLDYIAYYTFSWLFCLFTFRWSEACESRKKIAPFRHGPWLFTKASDFFVCVMGQCARHTSFETLYKVCLMWMLIPWLKYYVNCNPWIYDLEYRLCQQISTEMNDLGDSSDVADTGRKIISRARQHEQLRSRLNMWCFIPHYPYPPFDRRWALGMQIGGTKYPGKFSCIVHTTHAEPMHGNCICKLCSGDSENMPHNSLRCWEKHNKELKQNDPDKYEKDKQEFHYILSNSCKEPLYRVMLWYNNPFHFLTGWVEASVSNGGKAQSKDKGFFSKDGGGEHPMWLVTGKTRMISGRDSWTGSGMIDQFFDKWLPLFVHEMRFLRWMDIWKAGLKSPWTRAGVAWAKTLSQPAAQDAGMVKLFEEGGSMPTYGEPVSKEHLARIARHMDVDSKRAKQGLIHLRYMTTTIWTNSGIEWLSEIQAGDVLKEEQVIFSSDDWKENSTAKIKNLLATISTTGRPCEKEDCLTVHNRSKKKLELTFNAGCEPELHPDPKIEDFPLHIKVDLPERIGSIPLTQEHLEHLARLLHSTAVDIKQGMLSLGYAESTEVAAHEAEPRALAKAEAKYQEVKSVDGVSVPDEKIGRDLYRGMDIVTKMEEIQEQSEWCKCFGCTQCWMSFANTGIGRRIRHTQQSRDVFIARDVPLLTPRREGHRANVPILSLTSNISEDSQENV